MGKSKPTVTTLQYNQQGDVIKESNSYGNVKVFTYTYDAQNNWITRIEKETSYDKTTFEITEREIKYY
jgi:hypothetical protein